MTKTLSPEKRDEIRKNFDFFDKDKSGTLEIKEFSNMLKVIEPSSTTDQAKQGFKLIDDDCNGIIDFDEFIVWWESCWWQY